MIRNRLSGVLTVAGLLTGTGAVVSASCCVLPLALGGLGAGASVFSALEVIADYRTPLLVASAVLVVAAWCVYFGRRGAISTAIVLSIATAFVGTAAAWDYVERPLLKVIRASR
jgi:mercuric ion transport protein